MGAPRHSELDPTTHSLLLVALARIAEEHRTDDKLLLCRPRGVGRELLHALATAGHGWLGFRVQTPRDLAKELAAQSLAEDGLSPIDGFDELALLDEAIDVVLQTEAGEVLAELGEAVGFRNALAGSVRELRLAGLDANGVAKTRLDEPGKGAALAAIQDRYEASLRTGSLVDVADILRRAIDALSGDNARLPAERILLMPGMPLRGLHGALLEELLKHGAQVLPADPVIGVQKPEGVVEPAVEELPAGSLSYLHAIDELPEPGPPKDLLTPVVAPVDIDLFAAASPVDEIREVLRRAMAAAIPWDAVEIVTTDRIVYGAALDSLAPRLVRGASGGSKVTHAAGLPVSRTRIGRAVTSYLRWIREDFPDEIIRSLLQAGLLRAEGGGRKISGPRGARLIRGLRIGWGRDRYARQIRWALKSLDEPPSRRDRRDLSDDQLEAKRERRREDLEVLGSLLEAILESTPPTPDRLGAESVPVSPAGLADGVMRFLEFVPTPAEPDTESEAKRRLVEVLRRASATLRRETNFRSAVAILERFIDLRVPSPSAHGRVPWSSAGGYLHFSDVDHGGLCGRQHTFVVGLDASRFPGLGRQDALLLDHDRARLASDALPNSIEVNDEKRYALARLLARLRGHVTLSYSAWDAAEGRNLSPSPVLLQAQRLKLRDATASYLQLHEQTRPLVGPVPASTGLIDGTDVWLDRLNDNGVLRHGTEVVREAFANLDRGLSARDQRDSPTLTAHNGLIEARPEALDPRRHPEVRLSASRLETLAECPLQYFYRYVLRLREPDDVTFEPNEWLNARERGSMFHNVYERALSTAKEEDVDPADAAFEELTEKIFEDEIRRAAHKVPVPSRAVYEREVAALRADLDVFVEMVRADGPRWHATEWEFGFDEEERPPARLELGDATVLLRGAVDRIDELDNGGLGIVDYKTGSTYKYGKSSRVYDGGRRLQHALYTKAVEQHLNRAVETAAYDFPTRKGEGSRIDYERDELNRWPRILETLFDMIGAGLFPAPPDVEAPCKFCDFRPICRVHEEFGDIKSPPIEWAKSNSPMLEQYEPLRRVRQIDE